MTTQDELLQIYDQQGNVIEPLPRSVVHTKPIKDWHGVVNVWLVNSNGELVVSKRSETVTGNPGKWQTYFGGHVPSGMSHLETAIKELEEEIGMQAQPDQLHLIDNGKYSDENHLHFYKSYALLFEGSPQELNFADGEVSEAKWMSIQDYQQAKTENPEQWCNGCNEENYRRIKEWLKSLTIQ